MWKEFRTIKLGLLALFVLLFVAGFMVTSSNNPNARSVSGKLLENLGVLGARITKGDMSHRGGSPTVRGLVPPKTDDPLTATDESNDHLVGHFGTVTLEACQRRCYTLDADVEDGQVQRLYFPKGGWVDFDEGEIDESGFGSGVDENGRAWEFEGFTDDE